MLFKSLQFRNAHAQKIKTNENNHFKIQYALKREPNKIRMNVKKKKVTIISASHINISFFMDTVVSKNMELGRESGDSVIYVNGNVEIKIAKYS